MYCSCSLLLYDGKYTHITTQSVCGIEGPDLELAGGKGREIPYCEELSSCEGGGMSMEATGNSLRSLI